jgi:hypothetical protein
MSNVAVFMNLTLDGVMQAPGRPDEDLRGGFQHGGWADVQVRNPNGDPVLASVAAEAMANTGPCCWADEWPLLIHPLVLGSGPAVPRRRPIRRAPAGRHQDDNHRRAGRELPAGRTDGEKEHPPGAVVGAGVGS